MTKYNQEMVCIECGNKNTVRSMSDYRTLNPCPACGDLTTHESNKVKE